MKASEVRVGQRVRFIAAPFQAVLTSFDVIGKEGRVSEYPYRGLYGTKQDTGVALVEIDHYAFTTGIEKLEATP